MGQRGRQRGQTLSDHIAPQGDGNSNKRGVLGIGDFPITSPRKGMETLQQKNLQQKNLHFPITSPRKGMETFLSEATCVDACSLSDHIAPQGDGNYISGNVNPSESPRKGKNTAPAIATSSLENFPGAIKPGTSLFLEKKGEQLAYRLLYQIPAH